MVEIRQAIVTGELAPMTTTIVSEIFWRFNPATKAVDIIADGTILETCSVADAPARISFHQSEAAKTSGQTFVEARPMKRAGRA